MPGRDCSVGSGGLQQGEGHPLEFGFSDRMLRNEPRSLAAVFTHDVLNGPAMLRDENAQARCIPDVHLLHSGNVGASQFAGVRQFGAHTPIFLPHRQQFPPQCLVQHEAIIG